MTAGRPDADLIAAHLAGDPEAFAVFVRRHRDRMWAVALRTLRDPDEAADALQDALVSALRSAGTFRGQAKASTWLYRIVVNACLDRARRRRLRPTAPLTEIGFREPVTPRDAIADRDTRLAVHEALGELPVDQRAAIVLVDIEGYPVAEAAVLLGVPEGTVKSRCARGRSRLAVLLGHLRGDGEPTADGRNSRTATGGRPGAGRSVEEAR